MKMEKTMTQQKSPKNCKTVTLNKTTIGTERLHTTADQHGSTEKEATHSSYLVHTVDVSEVGVDSAMGGVKVVRTARKAVSCTAREVDEGHGQRR